tara:strand:- start:14025 stop:16064 length:2040 start_codon:yes stop_codon:yes gene_type:complete
MKLTLDVENTGITRDGKLHIDPYDSSNQLVMVGTKTDKNETRIFTFHHEQVTDVDKPDDLQKLLDQATVLIGHNIAYDLTWLWECGFKYDGPVFDTMLAEYVLRRGIKSPLTLAACAEQYKLQTQKQTALKEHLDSGGTVANMDYDRLCSYLLDDLNATQELSNKLYIRLNSKEDSSLMNTVLLTNKVAVCLAKINKRGMKVDKEVLKQVRLEFETEQKKLLEEVYWQTKDLMGDVPINLSSPEQLSWVIYSRKPKDKNNWADKIKFFSDPREFKKEVENLSELVYVSSAKQCKTCNGRGKIRKTKKDGSPFARENNCSDCKGEGYIVVPTKKIAGLKFRVPNADWISNHGFSTSKNKIDMLEKIALRNNMGDAALFLKRVRRLSALDTYLSAFVEGVESYTKPDGKLHVQLSQISTATGRFSGKNPNMQNMPRGGTFPIKKVFVSRFDNGKILEADFAQLEFRTAAFLSQDPVAMKEVEEGFDVHNYTAQIITDAGEPTTRQDAKAHTFAPLYGATGYGRTASVAAYYKHFNEKYKGIVAWHDKLAKEALNKTIIKTPSGREFSFPDVTRRRNGKPTKFTQIKNYPVQSFATADIVPLAMLHIERLLEGKQSCIVNTVHDSIVIDVHPDEEQYVLQTIETINNSLNDLISEQWSIKFNVPLLLESKIGPNWLDTKDTP